MRCLYHFALHPCSRKLRLILREKSLDFALETENYWERRPAFLKFNPSGEVPVLVEEDGAIVADPNAIEEYIEERYPEQPMIGATPAERAETRRLSAWFDQKFNREVTANLFDQKVIRRLKGNGGPDSQAIRNGLSNIHYHLDYVGWLADRRKWLAGDQLTIADLAAAAQLSVLDFIGDVPWDDHPPARDWYARVKSRPSFRPLLSDALPGFTPPAHYANLDF
jgi:glutathione S-transferase